MQKPTPGRIVLVHDLVGDEYRVTPAIITSVAGDGSVSVHLFEPSKSGLELLESADALAELVDAAPTPRHRPGTVAVWPDAPKSASAPVVEAPAPPVVEAPAPPVVEAPVVATSKGTKAAAADAPPAS